MHIVIGVLSAVAGLIWALAALQRSGFNPTALNPFLWYRRMQWRKRYGTHPLYNLDDPMDVAAVLVLGTVKCEGEISSDQKQSILELFQREFSIDGDSASDLLLASAHLIRDEVYLLDRLDRMLERCAERFTPAQVGSMVAMMTQAGSHDSPLNEEQRRLIKATERFFDTQFRRRQAWQPSGTR